MGAVGVVLLVLVLAAVVCAKARSAGGAAFFSVVAAVVFIATPVGQGVPGAIATFVSAFDQAATPALTGEQTADGEAQVESGGEGQ